MTTTDIAVGAISESEHARQLRRAVIASTVGTTIEWYDFLLYSIVTGLVFGKLTHWSACWKRLPSIPSALSLVRSVPRSSGISATASAARRR